MSTGSSSSLRAVPISVADVGGGVRQGRRPRQRAHVRLLQLDGDGARAAAVALQPAVGVLADRTDRVAQLIERGQVLGERRLGTDLLGAQRVRRRAGRRCPGQPVQRRPDGRRRGRRPPRSPLSAASAPTVSMPSRCSRSSATGPIPHSRRTGSPASSVRSSSRRTTRMPSGLASPDAILASCLPEPAPTEATRPVSARTLARRCSQNRSTSCGVGAHEFGRLAERLVERQLFEHRHHGAHGVEHPAAGHPVDDAARRQHHRRRRRPSGGPGASASPTARRTRAPRSWPPRRPRARRARRPGPGRPRSVGRVSCSTEAKNASMSKCRTHRPAGCVPARASTEVTTVDARALA